YYNYIIQAYRTERWWLILQAILPSALRCAYLTVSIEDYIKLSLESLNPNINLPSDTKTTIQNNFENLILNNTAPKIDQSSSNLSTTDIEQKWSNLALDSNLNRIIVDADTLKKLLECKVYFTYDTIAIDCEISLDISI
ncbi:unnamed protein product, partial [Didymodactylos carnosus]